MSRTQIWSSGGGVQSAAIAGLIATGRLSRPDYCCIVDTEREKQSTWDYLDSVVRPELAKVGLKVHRVTKGDFATVDLYGMNGDLLIPAYTTQGGALSKLPTFCSNEWKERVVKRWARSKGLEAVDNWIGISTDETSRVRTSKALWWQVKYPLIFDVRMRRQECIEFVESLGWPTPPRSACWMCPNQRNEEWAETRANRPDEFHKAIQLEKSIHTQDAHAFVHFSGVPLEDTDLSAGKVQGSLWANACGSGQCMV